MNRPDFDKLATNLSFNRSLVLDLTGHEDFFHDATVETCRPLAVVFAENESDVLATVLFCRENRLALVPRGAGTGLSGGCVPSEGSVVLSTERMGRIIVDAVNRTAFVGPGVVTKNLVDVTSSYGLTYPPDPASFEESTLGGNVAENAGGLRCKRFGVTRDYVLGLKAVTMDGLILETGIYNRQRGFALGDVLIGSEGTLAIITEIAVRLIDLPSVGDTILVTFDDPADAAKCVRDIAQAGIIPTVMEYMDGDAAACSNQYEQTEGLDRAAAILLIETPGENKEESFGSISRICKQNHCVYFRIESEPSKAEHLWKVRRNMSKAVEKMAKVRISEDVAVPNSKLPLLVEFVAETNQTGSLRINAYGHAGDGNLHVNFMAMRGDDKELDEIETAIEKLLKKALSLGGTLSGEHGIGLCKKRYLPLEFDPPTLSAMRLIKHVFDPDNLLNPGKIF